MANIDIFEIEYEISIETSERFHRDFTKIILNPSGGDGAVSNLVDNMISFISRESSRYGGNYISLKRDPFVRDLSSAINIFRYQLESPISMFTGFRNRFSTSILVDIFNDRTWLSMDSFSQYGAVFDRPGDGMPLYSEGYARHLRDRGAPIDLVYFGIASINFLTLFASSLGIRVKFSGPGGAPKSGLSGGGFPFTAICNRNGWILDYTPQYYYSPRRFGAGLTSPVHGHLPTSGNYYFEGSAGGGTVRDPRPHFASQVNNSTLVSL